MASAFTHRIKTSLTLFRHQRDRAHQLIWASLLIWGSMLILRQEIIGHLGLGTRQALESGLAWGWYFDAVMCLLAITLTAIGGIVHFGLQRWVWLSFGVFLWLASLANTLYIQFFDSPLNWWVVRLHWRDISATHDSALELSIGWFIPASILLVVLGLAMGFRSYGPGHRWTQYTRFQYTVRAFAFALALLMLWRGPAWFGIRDSTPLLRNNIVRSWLLQNFRSRLFYGVSTDWIQTIENDDSTGVLGAYRHVASPFPNPPPSPMALTHTAGTSAQETLLLRRSLGLPEKGPIHILVLFAESLRTYELNHPKIGPAIFPNLQRRLNEQAVFFTQGYSSSFNSGQTVRGQFSTLCSMLPNIAGAATYLAHTSLQTTCIQQVLKDAGYVTGWFNSFKAAYHNKRLFESLHGTDHFFDETYYKGRGITEKIGSWGLADEPVLLETAHALEDLAQTQQPIFANILTISTHHPQPIIPGAEVPKSLLDELHADKSYHGLLSSYRYLDSALEGFFETLFSGPLADNSLVVLLGDHGTPHRPPDIQSPVQHVESRFRIPIALITKNARPKKLNHVVHQIDIAPTIAKLVGAKAQVSWLGRGLFQNPGSPWVFFSNGKSSYRLGDKACYHLSPDPQAPLTCLDLTHGDPLFTPVLPRLEENPEETAFFNQVVQATTSAIALNKLKPKMVSSK